jgi:enoyl-CoA hydratase/carnithine racemase
MLRSTRQGAVLLLTLDRPEKRIALHPQMIRELLTALDGTEADDGIRVVVITGAGQSFCAGLDLNHLSRLDYSDRVDYMANAFRLFRQIHDLRQPIIAAVDGAAVAGGFDLAAFCDLRICTPEAVFAQTEILLGLTQIMYPLYLVIGLGRAKELALTGRTVAAEEAYRIGLVNRIVPRESLVAEALAAAESLAQRPPEALFNTKRLGRELLAGRDRDLFDRMFQVIASRLESKEHRDALQSYLATLRQRRSGSSEE